MDTLDDLSAADFEYRSDGRSVTRTEVLPAVAVEDRVGLVMGTGADGLGAATLLLSCAIAFYDALSERKDVFFEYPDFYTVQATTDPTDYRMFGMYPDHKNVAVAADAEAILRAVNVRGITTLLVPDRPLQTPDIDDVTRRCAERTIEHAFAYNPSGQLDEAGFEISLPREAIADWFETTVDSMADLPAEVAVPVGRRRGERISQSYRRFALKEALERLPQDECRVAGWPSLGESHRHSD